MAKREPQRKRIDISSARQGLTSNPFEGLARPPEDASPKSDANQPSLKPTQTPPAEPSPAFSIQRTKKGKLPVFLEKRPNGKNVTVIRNISGDLEALLKRLKRQCGAGGVVREDAIELQGDHRDRIEAFLRAK